MPAPVFIGDEISAAGFRLAGVDVRVPPRGEETEALREARERAELILITARCAGRIPQEILNRALAALFPLVLIVPDVRGEEMPPDLVSRLRAQLGMES